MKYIIIFILASLVIGCNVVDPTSLSGPVEEIPSEAFVNATVSILHEEGYTVEAVDHVAGLITTEWRDESSYASQTFWDVSRRTRIAVVLDFYTNSINVQMTKQKRDNADAWRNDGLSNGDRDRMELILVRIQERARAIGQREAEAVVTKRNIG